MNWKNIFTSYLSQRTHFLQISKKKPESLKEKWTKNINMQFAEKKIKKVSKYVKLFNLTLTKINKN